MHTMDCAGNGSLPESPVNKRTSATDACLATFYVTPSSQPQSKFFVRLPLEIRRLIYAIALGNERLELTLLDDPNRSRFSLSCQRRWLVAVATEVLLAGVGISITFCQP